MIGVKDDNTEINIIVPSTRIMNIKGAINGEIKAKGSITIMDTKTEIK